MGNAIQYRMPAGIPGAVTRSRDSTIEPGLYDSISPFSAFGLPGKIVSGKWQPVGAGDAASAVLGFNVRAYPAGSSTDPLGTSTPPQTGGIGNFLRRGFLNVQLNGATAAAKGGQVYIRVAAAATGKPIGGLEAASDSTNTIAPSGVRFTGPADANGMCEIEFNL